MSPDAPPNTSAAQENFRKSLGAWYRKNARDLPWRSQPSLYRTIVSEFMLQQTQVKTVLPYFARWHDALPDFAALAQAPEAAVLRLWEGLGYYSRARNLQRLAQAVVGLPELPQSVEAWLEMPGVGPYTAAAITSIAQNLPAACVDGNVVRILARVTAEATVFRDSGTAAQRFRPFAETLLNRDSPGEHNQAMMELGATVCLRGNPLCLLCPVNKFCAAFQRGDPENYPRFAARKIEKVEVARAWCERDGQLLLHRADLKAKRLAGQYELPKIEDVSTRKTAKAGKVLAVRKRAITRFQITESIYELAAPAALPPDRGLEWINLTNLDAITLSGPHRRWIGELLVRRENSANGDGCIQGTDPPLRVGPGPPDTPGFQTSSLSQCRRRWFRLIKNSAPEPE